MSTAAVDFGLDNINDALGALNTSWDKTQLHDPGITPADAHMTGFSAGIEFAHSKLAVPLPLAQQLYDRLLNGDFYDDYDAATALLGQLREAIELSRERAFAHHDAHGSVRTCTFCPVPKTA